MGVPAQQLQNSMFAFKPDQEYKVVRMTEGLMGKIFLGESSINPQKLEATLNQAGSSGYNLVFMYHEKVRKYIFFRVEAATMVFGKDRQPS